MSSSQEEEEDDRSTRSFTSLGSQSSRSTRSSKGDVPTYKALELRLHCGAVFERTKPAGQKLVCFHSLSKGPCKRQGHAHEPKARDGYYKLFRTGKHLIDGLEADFQDMATRKAQLKAQKAETQNLMMSMAERLQAGKDLATPTGRRGKRDKSPAKAPILKVPSTDQPKTLFVNTKEAAVGEKSGPQVVWGGTEYVGEPASSQAGTASTQPSFSDVGSPTSGGTEPDASQQILEMLSRVQADLQSVKEKQAATEEKLHQTRATPKEGRETPRKGFKKVPVETVTEDSDSEEEERSRPARKSSKKGKSRRKKPAPPTVNEESDPEEPPPMLPRKPSSSDSEEDSSDDDPSDDEGTLSSLETFRHPRKKKAPIKKRPKEKWYAACRGRHNKKCVSKRKKNAVKVFESSSKALMKIFYSKPEAKRWVEKNHRYYIGGGQGSPSGSGEESPSDVTDGSASEGSDDETTVAGTQRRGQRPSSKKPPLPPVKLSGKDQSTKDKEALMGITLRTCGIKELREKLSPPTLNSRYHEDLCETMLDAVSLPGKTQNTDTENALASLEASMGVIAESQRRNRRGEEMPQDLKWRNESRTTLKGVKSEEDLKELFHDILNYGEKALERVVMNQKTILSRQAWSEELIDVWSTGGYLFKICERSINWYSSLVQHIAAISMRVSWEEAVKERDYYLKEISMIRATATHRLTCLCQIYIFLREGAENRWRFPKLENQRLMALTKELEFLKIGGGGAAAICKKCGTGLHGSNPCPLGRMSNKKAKEEGRKMLRALMNGNTGTVVAGEEEGEEEAR